MRLMVLKGKGSLKRLQAAEKAPMEQNRALLMKIIKDNQNTLN